MPNRTKHPVTIEDLLSMKMPLDVALSPDGRRVAFSVRTVDFEKSRYTTQIHIAERVGEGKDWAVRQLTFSDEGASNPQWPRSYGSVGHADRGTSRGGSWLAFQASRKANSDGESKNQVWALDLRGGEARQITKAKEGVIQWRWCVDTKNTKDTKNGRKTKNAKNQKEHALAIVYTTSASKPTAEKTVRENERKRRFDPKLIHQDIPNMEFWIQPLEGAARKISDGDPGVGSFDISRDGTKIIFSTNLTGIQSDSDKFDLYVLEIASGKRRQLTSRKGSEWSPQFSPDEKWVSFFASLDEDVSYSRRDLWIVRTAGGELRNISQSFDRDVDEVRWSSDSRSLFTICQENTFTRLARFDLKGHCKCNHDNLILSDLSVSDDGKTLAVVRQSPTEAPDVWTVNARSWSSARVTDLSPQARKWQLPRQRIVRWNNEGFDHEGILCVPHAQSSLLSPQSGKLPLVVLIHGGPHGRSSSTMTIYSNPAWCAEGYACFIPNYRGSSGYSNTYGIANRGDLGGGDYRDIMAGVEKVLSLKMVDEKQMCVSGGSYGGYMTNWIIGNTNRFKAAASLFGIFSLVTDFSNSENPNWDPGYLGKFWWEDIEKYHEHSPARFVTSMKTPVLILHGEQDNNTFISNSKEMYQALRLLGRTVEFVCYPREGHGFREPNHQRDAFRRMLAWFDKYARSDSKGNQRILRVGDKVLAHSCELHVVSSEIIGDYAGVKAKGRWLEVTCVIQHKAKNHKSEFRIADFSLIANGRRLRPVGIPMTTLGEKILVRGSSRFAMAMEDANSRRALACAVVFDVPRTGGAANLFIRGFPAIRVWIPPIQGGN